MTKVWFITGSNRGLGRAFAKEAVKRGDKVVAGTRKIKEGDSFYQNENVLPVKLDVTDDKQIRDAVKQAINKFGQIDILLNNAGYGMSGALEETDEKQLKALFEADYFGTVKMIKAVLPYMRKQRSGYILNIASQGGLMGFTGSTAYCSAKFAVVGLSQALRSELAPFNIQVSAVCPGSFRTDFRDSSSLKLASSEIDDYDKTPIHKAEKFLKENNHKQQGDPAKAAEFLYDMVEKENLPSRLLIGPDCISGVLGDLAEQIKELNSYALKASDTNFE